MAVPRSRRRHVLPRRHRSNGRGPGGHAGPDRRGRRGAAPLRARNVEAAAAEPRRPAPGHRRDTGARPQPPAGAGALRCGRAPDPARRGPPASRSGKARGVRVMKRFLLALFKHMGLGAVTAEDLGRAARIAALSGLASFVLPAVALAQSVNVDLGNGAGLTDRVIQLAGLLTVLSLAPSIVIMTTSFVRIVVVLSLLRTALVMAPTFTASYNAGVKPLLDKKMELPQAFQASAMPVKQFMLAQVDEEDLALFVRLSHTPPPPHAQDLPLQVVTSAFMISELKRAFEIGFLLFVPFLVIDLVVASVLMSMGMMMLPPVVVSLPFKLIFFVLVDGWRLVAGSLIESFQRATGTG